MKRADIGRLSAPARLFLLLLPPLTAIVALCVGRIPLAPAEVLRSIAAHLGAGYELNANTEQVLWSMRFPRIDRKSTRLNSSHPTTSRMPSSA